MDQAMGDLQTQLDEVKRLWEEERIGRQRLEVELAALKAAQGQTPGDKPSSSASTAPATAPSTAEGGSDQRQSPKRTLDEANSSPPPGDKDSGERAKRQRVE